MSLVTQLGLMTQRWSHPCLSSGASDNGEVVLTLTVDPPLPHIAEKDMEIQILAFNQETPSWYGLDLSS